MTLVLSKLVTWMRGQPGTSDLRTLVYMDEVFGFVPPTADAAGEEADPDDPQAGARVRRRDGARDPEPGRPRLQGDVERRHVAGRPPPDRARQGARARGAELGGRATRTSTALDAAIGGLAKRQFLLVSAQGRGAGAVRDALGDVVPARPADAGPDRDADARRAADSGARAGAPRRRRPPRPAGERPRTRAPSRPRSRPASRSAISIRRRPGRRQVGAAARRRPAARPSCRAGEPSLRRRDGRDRRAPRSGRRCTARSTTGSTSSSETPRGLRRSRRSGRAAGRRGGYVLPQAPIGEARSSATAERADRAPPRGQPARSRSSGTAELKLLLAARRDARAVRAPLRRGGAGRGGPRDGEDPRPAGGEAGPARRRRWSRAAPGRGARVAAQRRARRPSWSPAPAPCSARCSAAGGARARSPGAVGSAASRRGSQCAGSASGSEPPRRRRSRQHDELAELEQEILDEVAEIDARWRRAAPRDDRDAPIAPSRPTSGSCS